MLYNFFEFYGFRYCKWDVEFRNERYVELGFLGVKG